MGLVYILELSQRLLYHRYSFVGISYFFIMMKISNFLSVNLEYLNIQRNSGYLEQALRWRTTSYLAKYILLSYLIQYPLFTYKYTAVDAYLQLLRMFDSKEYKSIDKVELLNSLKEKKYSNSYIKHREHIIKNFPKAPDFINLKKKKKGAYNPPFAFCAQGEKEV